MFHGAALIQVAEHPMFTAINAVKTIDIDIENAYVVNDRIGLYLKYATKPYTSYEEFKFTFTDDNIDEIELLKNACKKSFTALVCVAEKQICCLSTQELIDLIDRRKNATLHLENAFQILITSPKGRSMRAYINNPEKKKHWLGTPYIIAKKSFPDRIFE
jgi:hypothetical protein